MLVTALKAECWDSGKTYSGFLNEQSLSSFLLLDFTIISFFDALSESL